MWVSVGECLGECVNVHVCGCVRGCVRACARVRARACVCVHTLLAIALRLATVESRGTLTAMGLSKPSVSGLYLKCRCVYVCACVCVTVCLRGCVCV